MTRGQRDGTVTAAELRGRLQAAFPTATFPANLRLTTLLGHAIYHKLVTALEIEETTPPWAPRNRLERSPSAENQGTALKRRGTCAVIGRL